MHYFINEPTSHQWSSKLGSYLISRMVSIRSEEITACVDKMSSTHNEKEKHCDRYPFPENSTLTMHHDILAWIPLIPDVAIEYKQQVRMDRTVFTMIICPRPLSSGLTWLFHEVTRDYLHAAITYIIIISS